MSLEKILEFNHSLDVADAPPRESGEFLRQGKTPFQTGSQRVSEDSALMARTGSRSRHGTGRMFEEHLGQKALAGTCA